ncbi:MAG: hypothetical protein LBV60_19620 [Streptomyces sp.]|jgi:hypothetical protein|nr:hypothetical protein [Streptomyces sp.]
MNQPTPEDIAAMRADGSLRDYFKFLASQAAKPAPAKPQPRLTAVPDPGYRIAHVGGWPLGTAATGPTPHPDACTCPQHQQPTTRGSNAA